MTRSVGCSPSIRDASIAILGRQRMGRHPFQTLLNSTNSPRWKCELARKNTLEFIALCWSISAGIYLLSMREFNTT